MNILMMTNTYKPLLGGLEKSVESFATEFRKRGHRVVIVAPQYEGMTKEKDVVRVPAMMHFNGSDFSVQLPIPGVLTEALGDFKPDIVHSHHPFLIGDTALRVSSKYNVPLVFTHHTLYEENVHYIPGNEEALKGFVIELSTGYANLADQVFAPSQSVMEMIRGRGVETPVTVVPTGIWRKDFSRGSGAAVRRKLKIPRDAFVVGHLGRLAPEKNLEFLVQSVVRFMKDEAQAYFLIAGKGPSEEKIKEICEQEGVADRLRLAGVLQGKEIADAYHAMNVFAFASQSETQGLVLVEAMAAGIPVVAVDAPGVRDVVQDKFNGVLLERESAESFAIGLKWIKSLSANQVANIKKACRQTAEDFSMAKTADKALKVYAALSVSQGFVRRSGEDDNKWNQIRRLMQAQGNLVKNFTKATGALLHK